MTKRMKWEQAIGLSLVEILITIVVAGLVLTLAVNFFLTQSRVYRQQQAMSNLRMKCTIAMERIRNYLHMAGLDPLETGLFGVSEATPTRIAVTLDLNGNGVVDDSESIRIAWDATLEKIQLFYPMISTLPARTILEDVPYFNIVYLDSSFNQIDGSGPLDTEERAKVRAVEITVIAKTPEPLPGYFNEGTYPNGVPYKDRYGRYSMTIRVHLKNLSL